MEMWFRCGMYPYMYIPIYREAAKASMKEKRGSGGREGIPGVGVWNEHYEFNERRKICWMPCLESVLSGNDGSTRDRGESNTRIDGRYIITRTLHGVNTRYS